jgi:hypothetical protein
MTAGGWYATLVVGQGVTVAVMWYLKRKFEEWTASNLLLYQSLLDALAAMAKRSAADVRALPDDPEPALFTSDESDR